MLTTCTWYEGCDQPVSWVATTTCCYICGDRRADADIATWRQA